MKLLNKLPWLALALAGRPGLRPGGAPTPRRPTRSPRSSPTINSGDTAWMLISTLLVLFMILPGLALFYGGLVRAKNMLSVLMQCTSITAGDDHLRALRLLASPSAARRARSGAGFGKTFLGGVTHGQRLGHHPGAGLHRLPDDLRLHHPGADRRRLRRADEVLGGGPVRDPLGHASSTSRSPTWPGTRRALLRLGRDGLRRRHGGAHQRRHRGAGGRAGDRAAHRLPEGDHGAALDDADHGRRLDPLGRLVRLQCRLGALGRRRRRRSR